jgi:CubicO group peptidase (beta-lactamase class C family)
VQAVQTVYSDRQSTLCRIIQTTVVDGTDAIRTKVEGSRLAIRSVILVGFLSAYVLGFGGCVVAPKQEHPYWPTRAWIASTPEQQGLDSEALVTALGVIKTNKLPIHSLLVIRNGYLVLEAYFYPYSGKTLHAWASVTKSVTSTLIGLAIDEGCINGTQQNVLDFFPESRETLSGAKRRITVGDLLMMSTGLECGYRPGEFEALAMQRSSNFVAAVLQLPMHAEPGSEFSYCSGGMHLLSAIVTRATGISALEFARERLFEPLGIQEVIWPADPQGITYGWSDLRMHPRDMAKIGYLYLRKGEWEGTHILSSDWVRRSSSRQIDVPKGDADYGYGWWIGPRNFIGMYQAAGRGGQRVVVWPERDLVVIVNGAGLDPGQLAPLLLPSLKSDHALPENLPAYERLREKVSLAIRPPQPSLPPELPTRAREISGRKYVLEPNPLDIRMISLTFEGQDEARLNLQVWNKELTVPVGLDGVYRFSAPNPSDPTLAIKGHWASNDDFVIDYTEADGISHYRVTNVFVADKITMRIDDLTGLFPAQVITGLSHR